jgi:uncharacterized protein YlxP (DUF503 family)
MLIGVCTVDVHLPQSGSLKNKRVIIKSLKDRIKKNFNVSISEIDYYELWQRSLLGIAIVSQDVKFAHQVLSKVVDFIRSDARIEMIDYHLEMR